MTASLMLVNVSIKMFDLWHFLIALTQCSDNTLEFLSGNQSNNNIAFVSTNELLLKVLDQTNILKALDTRGYYSK